MADLPKLKVVVEVVDGRCRKCGHWGEEDKHGDPRRRSCEGMPFDHAGPGPLCAEDALVKAYFEYFYTAPDFGCVLFEAKEAGKE